MSAHGELRQKAALQAAEKQALERVMAEKEAEYARVRGGKYMKRDDFRQYQANIRGKHNQYKEMKIQGIIKRSAYDQNSLFYLGF